MVGEEIRLGAVGLLTFEDCMREASVEVILFSLLLDNIFRVVVVSVFGRC